MTSRILVLGAAGRVGHAAAEAFRDAGWEVVSLVRAGAAARAPRATEVVQSNERSAVVAAARGADVILHALNAPYTQWRSVALAHAYAAIDAAEAAGATLIFPGNLYNYGAAMPPVLDESTPARPTSRKGQVRETIELRMREATERGVRTIVLRAGDYFGSGRGSWFDLVIAKDLNRGRVTYPGPLDRVHEWAYLPDLAAAMVRLADRRATLQAFQTFGFPGHAVTGEELVAAIARALSRELRVKRMSWWFVRSFGKMFAMGRELAEIEYLWRAPHRIAGDRLKAVIGEIPHTPLDAAIAATLRDLGF